MVLDVSWSRGCPAVSRLGVWGLGLVMVLWWQRTRYREVPGWNQDCMQPTLLVSQPPYALARKLLRGISPVPWATCPSPPTGSYTMRPLAFSEGIDISRLLAVIRFWIWRHCSFLQYTHFILGESLGRTI